MLHFCLTKSVWNQEFSSGILILRSDDSVGNMLLAGGFHIVSIGSHPTITPAPAESVAQFCIPMWHTYTYLQIHTNTKYI